MDPDLLKRRVDPAKPLHRVAQQGGRPGELHRPTTRVGSRALPGVHGREIDVELLAGKHAAVAVDRELHPVADEALRVENPQVSPRREEVTRREVGPRVRGGQGLRKAPRLEQAVVRARVAEGHVPGAIEQADLAEHRGDPARRVSAPPVLVLVARP